MTVSNPAQKTLLRAGTSLLSHAGPSLAQVGPIRRAAVNRVDRWLRNAAECERRTGQREPGVADDRRAIGEAILATVERVLAEKRLSPAALRGVTKILVQSLLVEQGDQSAAARFRVEHQADAPTFLVISPGKACNLRCTGCYADSGATAEKLEWATFERIVSEAKTLWGTRFFVISGGEPFAYKSDGLGVLDMAERNPDCLFMAYTNGTLIDAKAADRLARAGNF